MWKAARQRARRLGVEFNITPDDVAAIWPTDNRCPVLGIPLAGVRATRWRTDGTPSLDRLNNAWGYIKGNVAVISWRANNIKSDATADELEQIATWMRDKGLA